MSRPVEWRAGGPLRMMAARGASSSLGRRLSGLAIPFGSETVIGNFTEVIRPGAVHLHRDTDVRLLWSHDPATVLGRTGSTLALSTTARGIMFAADLPSWASGLIETIQRGDVSGMSFGFVVREDLWEQPSSDRPPRRTILDLELHEISVVAFPAYGGTSVSAGSGLAAAPRAASVARGMALTTARAELADARARVARAEAAAIQARAAHTQLVQNRQFTRHADRRLAAVS